MFLSKKATRGYGKHDLILRIDRAFPPVDQFPCQVIRGKSPLPPAYDPLLVASTVLKSRLSPPKGSTKPRASLANRQNCEMTLAQFLWRANLAIGKRFHKGSPSA